MTTLYSAVVISSACNLCLFNVFEIKLLLKLSVKALFIVVPCWLNFAKRQSQVTNWLNISSLLLLLLPEYVFLWGMSGSLKICLLVQPNEKILTILVSSLFWFTVAVCNTFFQHFNNLSWNYFTTNSPLDEINKFWQCHLSPREMLFTSKNIHCLLHVRDVKQK